nr:hypothetical protein [Tanacetum cinerariifolium]
MTGSLDQSNPLHLHPNDSSCASIVSLKLTSVDNYRIWANALKLALQIKHKMVFITGTCVRSNYLASAPLLEQWDRFDILTKLHDCTYEARVELVDHGKLLRLMQFLMGLDDVYQPIRSSILTREILPEVKDAFVIISKEESYRGMPASSVKTEKPQASAFVSRNVLKSLVSHQVLKFMSLFNDKSGSSANAYMAGVNHYYGWIIDYEANRHMTNSCEKMFYLANVSKLSLTIGHPNSTLAKMTYVGNLRLNSNVVLFDVLVISEYIDLKKEKVLGTGRESAGLYLFDSDYASSAMYFDSKFLVCYVSKDVWHNRLGQLANQVLKLLKGSLNLSNIDHNSPCEVFHKGPYKVVSREGY